MVFSFTLTVGQIQQININSCTSNSYEFSRITSQNIFQLEKIIEIYLPKKILFHLLFVENRVHEAGYFHAISKPFKITVNLVHLSGKMQTGDEESQILTTMSEIQSLEPDIILLYTTKKNIELILQQRVIWHCLPLSLSTLILWLHVALFVKKLRIFAILPPYWNFVENVFLIAVATRAKISDQRNYKEESLFRFTLTIWIKKLDKTTLFPSTFSAPASCVSVYSLDHKKLIVSMS